MSAVSKEEQKLGLAIAQNEQQEVITHTAVNTSKQTVKLPSYFAAADLGWPVTDEEAGGNLSFTGLHPRKSAGQVTARL